ncbi:hypothetical protein PFLUV_G00067980 [Perca fluviatilis]|uniref:Uncharacterized protein n=1 Tax=Perca fluviatilis TaxID=8168 RepID=A0A6A5FG61_PERFL|nr:hypothetical protein PFLUV_G00067980 [Perca fluviatilis]
MGLCVRTAMIVHIRGWRSVSVSSKDSIFSWRGDWVTQSDCNTYRHTSLRPQHSFTCWLFLFYLCMAYGEEEHPYIAMTD